MKRRFLLVCFISLLAIIISSATAQNSRGVNAPDKIIMVSGNDQTGYAGQMLPGLLVVQVLDKFDRPSISATVTFSIFEGEGYLSWGALKNKQSISLLTDFQGKCAVVLTLGRVKGTVKVMAIVDQLDPVIFTANIINSKPDISPIGDKEVREGETLQFTISATDPDKDDQLTLSSSSLPANANFDVTTGLFTFSPDYTQAGVYNITFTVTDGALLDSETVTIKVANVNRAPVIAPIGNKTIDENWELVIAVVATDPDGEELTYSASGLPTGATFDADKHLFRWKPGYDTVTNGNSADFIVVFTVRDPWGLTDSEQVKITVKDVPPPPAPDIRVVPLKLDFGTVFLGNSSQRIFRIHNDGNEKLNILQISSIDPQFRLLRYVKINSNIVDPIEPELLGLMNDQEIISLIGGNATFVDVMYRPNEPLVTINYPIINPGECLLIRAEFKPTSVGTKVGRFLIESDDPDEPLVSLFVSGKAVQVPDIDVFPLAIDFGEVEIGSISERSLHIANKGNAVLVISSITSNDSQFTISDYHNVNPGGEIVVSVSFAPKSVGTKITSLLIESNDPDEPVVTVNLRGKGIYIPKPNIRINPESIDFGDVIIGSSAQKEFSIYNDGDAILKVSNIVSSSNEFIVSLTSSDIIPGSYEKVTVKFSPTQLGQRSGSITVYSNDPDEPTKVLNVKGKAIPAPVPDIRVLPTSIDFGNVALGESSSKSFRIYNDGTAVLTINSITSDNTMFTVTYDRTIAPGSFSTAILKFTPTSVGLKTATITIRSNDPDEPVVTMPVQGTGYKVPVPDIRIAPIYIDFGSVELGSSLTKEFKIYNDGDGELVIKSVTSDNDQFVVVKFENVPAGGSISVLVKFVPASLGIKTGLITVMSNDPDEPNEKVYVQGTCIPIPVPDIDVEPTSLNFGRVEIGSYKDMIFKIFNRGNAPLQILSITSSDAQFSLVPIAQVLIKDMVIVSVRFTPASVGLKRAHITIKSNDPDEPLVTIDLYGEGFYPGFPDSGYWVVLQKPGILPDLYALQFVNENFGWAVGYNGTIARSNDGGLTWVRQYSGTTVALSDVCFTDPTNGWIVGQYGTILRTTNGGVSWIQQNSNTTNSLRAVTFINPRRGWAVGEYGTILSTVDGAFWSLQNSGTNMDLNDVFFINAYEGWVAGNYGVILHTQDGGQTWVRQNSNTSSSLYDVEFVNQYDGWIVGNEIILHTSDGGATWVQQPFGYNHEKLSAVDFINVNEGWIVGSNGLILRTSNSGQIWIKIDSGVQQSLNAVQFLNPTTGWSVGSNGIILGYNPNVKTYIDSVVISGSPARGGDTIKITVKGQPNNEARYSIEGVLTNAPMNEIAPGTYTASYVVPLGIEAKNAIVTVVLKNTYGNVATDSTQRVTIDSLAVITSTSVSPTVAKAGDVITVTMSGESKGLAKFTIETVISDVFMEESLSNPGNYIGRYSVPPGISAKNVKVKVTLTDGFGNTSVKEAGEISVFSAVKIMSVSVSGSPAKLDATIVIIMTGDPNCSAKFSIDGVASDISMTENQPGVYIGTYTARKGINVTNAKLTVRLSDAFGNVDERVAGSVTIDTESKIQSVAVSGSPGKAGDMIKVTLIGEPGGRAKFSIEGVVVDQNMVEQTSGNYVGTYIIQPGVNISNGVVTVTLVDPIGNVGYDMSQRVTIDTTPPIIGSVNVIGSPAKARDVIKVSLIGTPASHAKFTIEGITECEMKEQPSGSGIYSGEFTVPEGVNAFDAPVTIYLIDAVGNVSTDTSQKVTIDTRAPIIMSVSVAGSPAKLNGIIKVTISGEPNASASFSIEGVVKDQKMLETPSGSGNYYGEYKVVSNIDVKDAVLTVSLTDAVGNTSFSKDQKVSIDSIPPVITSVVISGSPAKIGETVSIQVYSERGASVTFSINGIAEDIPMEELKDKPGIYLGTYKVKEDKGVKGAKLIVTAKDVLGNLTTDESKTIELVYSYDVNRDGVVNLSDLISIWQVFGMSFSGRHDADVNGDGFINIIDLVIVSKHFGLSSSQASPMKVQKVKDARELDHVREIYDFVAPLASYDKDASILKELLIQLVGEEAIRIRKSELLQNYPNPFNPETWIPFRLANPGNVTIEIYSLTGQLVRRLDLGYMDIGEYLTKDRSAYWDGKNEQGERVSSGVYFYSIRCGDFSASRKMVVNR